MINNRKQGEECEDLKDEIVDLRNKHFTETGNSFTEDNENPSWEYVNWLEDRILKEQEKKFKELVDKYARLFLNDFYKEIQ